MILMRRAAEAYQNSKGHFYFDEIFDSLESAYGKDEKWDELEIVNSIDYWVENDPSVDFLGKEGESYTYRLKNK